jgi:hypothetical protein
MVDAEPGGTPTLWVRADFEKSGQHQFLDACQQRAIE